MSITINIKKCEGYIWYSDETEPKEIYIDKPCEKVFQDTDNPFVIEAMLVDKDANVSHMIKYVDGQYIHSHFPVPEAETVIYLPNKMSKEPRIKKLKFIQVWKAVKDESCDGFETLVPAELVFAGFDKEG